MFNQAKQNQAVHHSLAGGGTSGDTYTGISYGDDLPCPNCGLRHSIFETNVIYDMCRILIKQMTQQGVAVSMMIGVLRGNNNTFYAASSPADGTAGQLAFRATVQGIRFVRFTLCGNIPDQGSTSRAGSRVTAQVIRQCTVNGSPIAGRCAAPKLVHYAIGNNIPRPWCMSEVLYDPLGQNPHYDHFQTAQSCLSCRNLLPQMLCTRGNAPNLIEFRGALGANFYNSR